jgi:hypothetical protein
VFLCSDGCFDSLLQWVTRRISPVTATVLVSFLFCRVRSRTSCFALLCPRSPRSRARSARTSSRRARDRPRLRAVLLLCCVLFHRVCNTALGRCWCGRERQSCGASARSCCSCSRLAAAARRARVALDPSESRPPRHARPLLCQRHPLSRRLAPGSRLRDARERVQHRRRRTLPPRVNKKKTKKKSFFISVFLLG